MLNAIAAATSARMAAGVSCGSPIMPGSEVVNETTIPITNAKQHQADAARQEPAQVAGKDGGRQRNFKADGDDRGEQPEVRLGSRMLGENFLISLTFMTFP